MGPFPHDAPKAKIDAVNVAGTDGFEFVEYAASERGIIEPVFEMLGFTHIASHRSKQVDLWRQGGINIVVNTEHEGFAHSSYIVHGTNICDIGLKVEDAAATVERARALGADLFEQPAGPGELKIPAIRGIGGGVLHFLDDHSDLAKVWDIEFEPVADAARPVIERVRLVATLPSLAHLARSDQAHGYGRQDQILDRPHARNRKPGQPDGRRVRISGSRFYQKRSPRRHH